MCALTWNVCGDAKAATAPADYTHDDKWVWLRGELELLQPHILALQECPTEDALAEVRALYTLVGSAKAHAGYVHLYVKHDVVADRLCMEGRPAPAVAARVSLGSVGVVVVAVHLAANTKGDLPSGQEGPDGRLAGYVGFISSSRRLPGPSF